MAEKLTNAVHLHTVVASDFCSLDHSVVSIRYELSYFDGFSKLSRRLRYCYFYGSHHLRHSLESGAARANTVS